MKIPDEYLRPRPVDLLTNGLRIDALKMCRCVLCSRLLPADWDQQQDPLTVQEYYITAICDRCQDKLAVQIARKIEDHPS